MLDMYYYMVHMYVACHMCVFHRYEANISGTIGTYNNVVGPLRLMLTRSHVPAPEEAKRQTCHRHVLPNFPAGLPNRFPCVDDTAHCALPTHRAPSPGAVC